MRSAPAAVSILLWGESVDLVFQSADPDVGRVMVPLVHAVSQCR